jgi:hypothetical protein
MKYFPKGAGSTLRIDSGDDVASIVARLNGWQPSSFSFEFSSCPKV